MSNLRQLAEQWISDRQTAAEAIRRRDESEKLLKRALDLQHKEELLIRTADSYYDVLAEKDKRYLTVGLPFPWKLRTLKVHEE